MAVKRLSAGNFKSFRNFATDLSPFTVIIGANASGKSNFIQVFRFLSDIASSGLENALSIQGGVKYLRNSNIGSNENLFVKIDLDQSFRFFLALGDEKSDYHLLCKDCSYEFALAFHKRGSGFRVVRDQLVMDGVVRTSEGNNYREHGNGKITISRTRGKSTYQFSLPDSVPFSRDDRRRLESVQRALSVFAREDSSKAPHLLLEGAALSLPIFPSLNDFFRDIRIFDFDPKLPKKAVPITGRASLDENGSNLAIVLNNILSDREKSRKFSNLVRDLLPFVSKIGVERFADKSMIYKFTEKYAPQFDLPASLMSDGTVNVTALVAAIYFEDAPIVLIEEPERNIHPFLIARVVEMLKDASKRQQIIVTTQSPEIVKHASLDSLILMARDTDGFTNVCKPAESDRISAFLQSEMGVEDLFVHDLLSV